MIGSVRGRRAFARFRGAARRARSGPLWITAVADPDGPSVAYAIGRDVGSAVQRNRLRRRLRAIVGQLDAQGALGPGLYLIGARPGAAALDFAELDAIVRSLVRQVSS